MPNFSRSAETLTLAKTLINLLFKDTLVFNWMFDIITFLSRSEYHQWEVFIKEE